jgi:hypothetical protein
MYEIEATVTTATQDQLGLTANWPLDWLHAAGFRSTEIVGKLGPTEKLGEPGVATERRAMPGNRGLHPRLQVGDRVAVRLFFSGESRQQTPIVISPEIQFWIDHKNEAQKALEAMQWFRSGSITEKTDEELTVISSILATLPVPKSRDAPYSDYPSNGYQSHSDAALYSNIRCRS